MPCDLNYVAQRRYVYVGFDTQAVVSFGQRTITGSISFACPPPRRWWHDLYNTIIPSSIIPTPEIRSTNP